MFKLNYFTIIALFFAFVVISCDTEGDMDTDLGQDTTAIDGTADDMHLQDTSYRNVQLAVAELSPTQGNEVRGTVTFTKEGDAIKVVVDIQNLTPGKHGFHIHETGDCSAPDASSAGGHFDPQNSQHGEMDDHQTHAGDFGNIEAGSDGIARMEFTTNKISFTGSNSIINKAIVVHADEDDLTTQPTGNSGPRVACGVIKPEGMNNDTNSATTDVFK